MLAKIESEVQSVVGTLSRDVEQAKETIESNLRAI
jgi:hypothetical protein